MYLAVFVYMLHKVFTVAWTKLMTNGVFSA